MRQIPLSQTGRWRPPSIAFLRDHLDVAKNALSEGIYLKGYFTWSLLDNYEWAMGYAPRFGLVHVDFDTFRRRPKASYRAFRKALSRR